MATYDLDDKKGFFSKFTLLNPSKCLSEGDKITLKHYNMFSKVNTKILYFDDKTVRLQTEDNFDIIKILEGDPVVLSTKNGNDQYSIAGDIAAIDTFPPFKIDVRMNKIHNMKELRKNKRFFISELCKLFIVGEVGYKKAIVKNISFGGIKLNAEDIMQMNEILEVKMEIEDIKFILKCKVVRKIPLIEFYEYGLEIMDITESNLLMLHRYMNTFEFS
ncbi:MAG: PilZ domain-containing protein [Clostridiales bacterium]